MKTSLNLNISKYDLKHLQRTYKFRLYPNLEQSKKLQNNLAVCRWVYNKMIEHSKNKYVSRNDLNYFLTELKHQEPWLYSYHSKMLQMVSTQIDGAQKALKQLRKNGHKTGNRYFEKGIEYFRTIACIITAGIAGSNACRDLNEVDEAGSPHALDVGIHIAILFSNKCLC